MLHRLLPAMYLACCQTPESSEFPAFYLKKIGKSVPVEQDKGRMCKKAPHTG
ncbi:hypothetical protein GJA_5172 [Janthinobacterium agaricidamnosum NBRC 102515 = DSM 9628]|uniref:Uncharacterized protein n=1 Tax=Janthinobacterium agaricidamnosum NBRC 102515 = DSM 9628 TaxID=1349767 RepID=W0VAC4_9BURK|nr:hypothetical protein GJA_5172 [Janthinobacterium agaricidamnosum NBRC 102515 = DSM 9628]